MAWKQGGYADPARTTYESPGTNSPTDVITSIHFYISDAVTSQSAAIFTEVSGLSIDISVETHEDGGTNFVRKIPKRVTVGDITLQNGITTSNELWDWFMEAVNGNPSRRNVSILIVNQKKEVVHTWSFIRALPIKWSLPALKSDQSIALIQTLVFTHEGLQGVNA